MEKKTNSFFSPQRQSKAGIALLFLYHTGSVIRNLWVFIFLLWVKKDRVEVWMVITGILVILFFLIVSAVLSYFNFRYFIDAQTDEFVIHKGLINKSTTRIKTGNIQEVNISQPFIHKIFNIFKLEIDSPGSSEKEVVISALTKKNAFDLKEFLIAENMESSPEISDKAPEKQYVSEKISAANLLKYGITANYIQSFFAMLSIVLYGISKINEFLKTSDFGKDFDYEKVEHQILNFSVPVLAAVAITVIVIGVIVNSVRTIIRFYGFKIIENSRSFSLEYGLFSTKNAIVSKNKVQVISETQNWFQKKMNISFLKFLQIGKEDQEKNTSSVPGVGSNLKNKIFTAVWGENPVFNTALQVNFRWIIVKNFIFILVPAMLIFLADKNLLISFWWIFLIYIIAAEIIIFISWYNLRLYFNDRFIRIKSGFWDIHYKTFEIDKLQTVKISQYFWQKKTNLGSVSFYTSSGKFGISALDFSVIKKLCNYAVFKIETSKK